MGQKTHPKGFRLGGIRDWNSHWFAAHASDYKKLTSEDYVIRKMVNDKYSESGAISRIDIERGAQEVVVTIYTARPGIIIGRGGTAVDVIREDLESLTGKKARLNIQEVRQPDLDALLVGRSIAEQLQRRVAYRRALRTAAQRTMQSGASGIKMVVSGRLGGAEIARSDKYMEGRVPLHTLRAQIDYAVSEAFTTFGVIGIKVWIYTGDVSMSSENLRARTENRTTMSNDRGDENSNKRTRGGRRKSRKKDIEENVATQTN
ncbi:30S ribosomal protein S3 [Dehalococcoidia bacterium]|nr:30S ribosomal protein S3 [Dehalococcoidia bacterium]